MAWSPDGTTIASAEDNHDNNVVLWDVGSQTLLRTWHAEDAFDQTVGFTPDGRELVTASGYTFDIRFWDPSNATLLLSYDRETGAGTVPLLPFALSNDGLLLLYGRSDATVVLARNPFPPAGAVPGATPRGPAEIVLGAPCPNPFYPRTTFALRLPGRAQAALDLYDLGGRHVRRLAAGELAAGEHALTWDGRDDRGALLPSGTYYYRLLVDGRPCGEGKAILLR